MLKVLRTAVAAGLLAALIPALAASGAHAGQCDPEIYIFSRHGVFLPENPANRKAVTTPLIASNFYGCQASPDVEANTNLIYPGANVVDSRLLTGDAGIYCFHNLFAKCGSTVKATVVDTTYTQSELLSMDPATFGCLGATFDGRGYVEYCTIDRLSP
ncbi:MAG TPA: hypothetical protein VNE62_00595 [Actinomycetota bacterium]|nr:hypothetical protein [Actinomycetota bacterium]